jgi:hypothetical protein
VADGQHYISHCGRTFLGDEELHLAPANRTESGEQPLLGERVVDHRSIASEVKAEWCGAHFAHGREVVEIAIVAGAHQGRGSAVAFGFDHAQRARGCRDHVESEPRVVVGADFRKQQRQIEAIAGGVLISRSIRSRAAPRPRCSGCVKTAPSPATRIGSPASTASKV